MKNRIFSVENTPNSITKKKHYINLENIRNSNKTKNAPLPIKQRFYRAHKFTSYSGGCDHCKHMILDIDKFTTLYHFI